MLLASLHWTEDFLISFSFDQRTSQNNTKLTLRCVEQLNAFRSGSRPSQMMSVGSDKICAEGQKEQLGRASKACGLDSAPHLTKEKE